ncbi:MAG: bifunctional phosphoglucose/phosphomannose isomerase [Gemmatimonadota bacterium]|nr:bifunctional phosphoglucose/phosphomannose isomerase [Gemmatimonadota bacterium]
MSSGETADRIERWREREAALDRGDMRGHVAGFPDQLARAIEAAAEFARELEAGKIPRAIAVVGMGGSAIGGDLVAAASEERRHLPLVVVRGYDLPSWIDQDALVIASSYSGNTEETLSAYGVARERGSRTVAITSGGELAERAGENDDPILALPEGFPPRAAVGWSFAGCAMVAARHDPGLDPEAEADRVRAAAERLRPCPGEWLAWDGDNPALEIAAGLENRIPVVYGGHAISVAAALRWKCQLNENAKMLCWHGALPEQNHNEIAGFEGTSPGPAGRLALVHLETPWDDPRLSRRFAFLREYCEGRVAGQHRVEARGDDPLTGMLWLCHLGDCASFLASVITGNDPTPVAPIESLKRALRDRGSEPVTEESA